MLVFLNLGRQERALGPGLFHKISVARGGMPQAVVDLVIRPSCVKSYEK